jgi:hypothetical protein
LRALEFADGNYDDEELREELARNGGEPASTNQAESAVRSRSLRLIDARHRFQSSNAAALQSSENELLSSYRQLPAERQKDLMLIAEAYYRAHGVDPGEHEEE